ncbi:hypothetical protein KP509_19G059300 [Ceratopteris richardii]|uniref:Uncharacterized protein n=1 Tax=Ceratopteris richardii TaxID=49495 RepID=A0A8T2SPE4_CERRI|nr:hypothetical protein KP509_19G059300 [Ceratopteris richardii]
MGCLDSKTWLLEWAAPTSYLYCPRLASLFIFGASFLSPPFYCWCRLKEEPFHPTFNGCQWPQPFMIFSAIPNFYVRRVQLWEGFREGHRGESPEAYTQSHSFIIQTGERGICPISGIIKGSWAPASLSRKTSIQAIEKAFSLFVEKSF